MAENFQAGVCGPTWWNPSRSALGLSSPCSPILTDHIGSFGWSTEPLMSLKAATSGNSDESGSVSDEYPKPHQMDSGGGGPAVFMDSALQMLGIDLSSPSSTTTTTTTSDWNQQSLLVSGRTESNYNPTILQEEMNSGLNFRQETGMGCLTPVSGDCTASFPAMSAAYPTTLLQTLLDTNHQQLPLPQQQSLFDDWSLNYSPSMSYPVNLNEFSSPSMRPSLPKQQNIGSWNNSGGSTFFPSAKAQFSASTFEEKRTCPKLSSKVNENEVTRQSGSIAKRNSNEPGPTFKRPRIETPSPLPTFKVRKEKLGDRITALQQLVSPFGKTDTASVLQEAIEYIKFLHDQVNVLSTPYMKNGAALQQHQNSNKKDSEEPKQDLKSRGLCLVPISSTFPVATETTADFWTPTFGGSFR